MLKVLRDEYAGDVHVSTGMTTLAEIEDVVAFFEATGQAKRCPLCTTAQSFEEKEKCLGRCKECGVDYEAPASFVTQFLISKPPKPRD